jgi:hypothetical protein
MWRGDLSGFSLFEEAQYRGVGAVVDPFAQQRAAVDQIDRQAVVLVLVGEVAPQRVVRLQAPDRLEGERLQAPRAEGVVA